MVSHQKYVLQNNLDKSTQKLNKKGRKHLLSNTFPHHFLLDRDLYIRVGKNWYIKFHLVKGSLRGRLACRRQFVKKTDRQSL